MVKGVSRRVIVVRSPDPKLFEQAIFIVREDAMQGSGVTADKVLAEARQAARHYVRCNSRWGKGLSKIPAAGWLAAGAVLATTLWSLAIYFWI